MNIKAFFVDALKSALDLKIGTPADVLRHVTPDVLAAHLPRPLWARLLTACLGAPRVDAQLVVETIGIPNLCEHIPSNIIWTVIAEIANRSLGKGLIAAPPEIDSKGVPVATAAGTGSSPVSQASSSGSKPTAAAAASPPIDNVLSDLEQDEAQRSPSGRPRPPTGTRFRQSSTSGVRAGIGSNPRRPQAAATPAPTSLPRPLAGGTGTSKRGGTDIEPEQATSVETADWGAKEIDVDDAQLVDWQTDVGSANAITGDDDFSDLGGRKR